MPPLQFKQRLFRCNLTCATCTHRRTDGQPCKNRVCHGGPWCYAHNRSALGVRAPVLRHLFATRDFPPGHFICPYYGEIITNGCLNARYPGDTQPPYYTPAPHVPGGIDAACTRGVAAYVRPRFRPDGTPDLKRNNNAEIVYRRGRGPLAGMWLKSLKRIRKGQEIFCYSGRNFMERYDYSTYRSDKPENDPCENGRVVTPGDRRAARTRQFIPRNRRVVTP